MITTKRKICLAKMPRLQHKTVKASHTIAMRDIRGKRESLRKLKCTNIRDWVCIQKKNKN